MLDSHSSNAYGAIIRCMYLSSAFYTSQSAVACAESEDHGLFFFIWLEIGGRVNHSSGNLYALLAHLVL